MKDSTGERSFLAGLPLCQGCGTTLIAFDREGVVPSRCTQVLKFKEVGFKVVVRVDQGFAEPFNSGFAEPMQAHHRQKFTVPAAGT